MSLFNVLKHLIQNTQKKNQADPKVETAPPSVFENMAKKVQEAEQSETSNPGDLMDMFEKHMGSVKQENEADPNVATADSSVFSDMQAQIDALKAQLQEKNSAPTMEDFTNSMANAGANVSTPEVEVNYTEVETPAIEIPAEASSPEVAGGTMAMTNSQGGSLGLRQAPDMGSPEMSHRIPDSTVIKVLEYSDKMINLDGANVRWVRVEFNGVIGWTLESYLNFN